MNIIHLKTEEQLVAELAHLGVNYLSCQSASTTSSVYKPHELIAKLACQPSSRIRAALITLFLAHPDYARDVHKALRVLKPKDAQTLRFFYTAAVYLQQENTATLQTYLGKQWRKLPDLFAGELGITGDSPDSCLRDLACLHAQLSGENLNWVGTYKNAARHLFRRWELEKKWKA